MPHQLWNKHVLCLTSKHILNSKYASIRKRSGLSSGLTALLQETCRGLSKCVLKGIWDIVEAIFLSCPWNRLESWLVCGGDCWRERRGLTLGKTGSKTRLMQSSCCPQLLVEPTWTMRSHPNGEQKIQTKGMGKDEDVDVSRARHELVLGGLAAQLMPKKGSLWEQTAAWRT